MSLVLDEHRSYLADPVRLAAFERAIAATVRRGDIVLDLGSGTGILGLLAARAGAAKVYAIEETALSGLARDIAAANGYGDCITVVRGLSTWVTLPERADVMVTDQIGNFGVEAGIFEYMPDARRRLLKPDARTIPRQLTWYCAPVESAEVRSWISFWSQPRAGFDFSPILRPAGSSGYPTVVARDSLLGPGHPLATAATAWLPASGVINGEVSCVIDRAGTLDGVAGWFLAELADGVSFTNSPETDERIDRRQIVLPIEPTRVAAGDTARIRVRIRPDSLMADWQVVVSDALGVEKSRCRRSTFEGMLVASEDLQRRSSSAVLTLSAHGRARKLALDLCDGTHTVSEIEAQVRREFADWLATDEDAAAFVAGVLAADAV